MELGVCHLRAVHICNVYLNQIRFAQAGTPLMLLSFRSKIKKKQTCYFLALGRFVKISFFLTREKRCVTDENIELINLHYSGTLKQNESNLLDKRTQLNSKKFVVPDNLPRRTRLRGGTA